MNALRAEPLARLREGLHVSVSQVRCWIACSQAYAYRYVLGTPPSHRSVALSFGSAVHHALALHYQKLKDTGTKAPVDELHAAFADRLDVEVSDTSVPIRYDDGDDAGRVKDKGVAMLSSFHEKGFTPDEVLGVEVPFGVGIPDPETGVVLEPMLVGAIDLVARHEGRVVLVEHKTAGKRFDAARLRHDLQPTTYAFAARSLRIVNPGLAFHLLLKSKGYQVEYTPVTRTKGDETEMIETFTAVLMAVEAGVFFRNRGWACGDCEFGYRCGG
jgi:hypothetical protein